MTSQPAQEGSEIGMVGLGVIGRNLLLNMADHCFSVAGYDKDPAKVVALSQEANQSDARGAAGIQDFIALLRRPRAIMMLVPAGAPVPWLRKDKNGKPIVALLACYSGRPDEGEKAVAPIKSFGSPIGDVLVRRPYAQMQSLLDATRPKGHATTGKASTSRASSPRFARKSSSMRREFNRLNRWWVCFRSKEL